MERTFAKVTAKKYNNAENASIVTFSQCSSESPEGAGQNYSGSFVKDTTNHKSSSLNNRKVGNTRLSDVLSFYHSIHAQRHIQSAREQCTSNHRLLSVNNAVIKCFDQVTKMKMKTRNGHPGKLFRCKFTEAAERWLPVE